jgi:hypothetical protein
LLLLRRLRLLLLLLDLILLLLLLLLVLEQADRVKKRSSLRGSRRSGRSLLLKKQCTFTASRFSLLSTIGEHGAALFLRPSGGCTLFEKQLQALLF